MGRFAAAAPRLERVVQLTREVLGPDHPGRVIDLNNYASLLRDQASLTVQEAVLDADHPDRALKGARRAGLRAGRLRPALL